MQENKRDNVGDLGIANIKIEQMGIALTNRQIRISRGTQVIEIFFSPSR